MVLADTEDTWKELFRRGGAAYEEPRLVLFSGATESACGFAGAAVGPFYCPADRKVYLDLDFFAELDRRFGAPGDFAQAYVAAHEVGHDVQTLLGISHRVREAQAGQDERGRNRLQVTMELQADCLAGGGAPCAAGAQPPRAGRPRGGLGGGRGGGLRPHPAADAGPGGARRFHPRHVRAAPTLVRDQPEERQPRVLRHLQRPGFVRRPEYCSAGFELPIMSLKEKLEELCRRTRAGWKANPDLVQVDARREESLLGGGYYDRQILELVQNAADAALAHETARIELRLTASHLYAANTGEPLSPDGLRALILGDVSPKGGDEIGRFGLGFRSLLRLGGVVDMVSAGIAFRFDPAWCAVEARQVAALPADAEAPGMRLARPLSLTTERKRDPILADLLEWADTVVRAELADPDAVAAMRWELERFPVEFLLFQRPDLEIEILLPEAESRRLHRERREDLLLLVDDGKETAWQLFRKRFAVEDADAKRDAGRRQARPEVDIAWAVPAEVRDPRGGELWNAFPTRTPSVLPGILDTRWKLNSDRTALTGEA